MKETLKQKIIKRLSEINDIEIRNRAIKNIDMSVSEARIPKNTIFLFDDVADILANIFDYTKTPEGKDFWKLVEKSYDTITFERAHKYMLIPKEEFSRFGIEHISENNYKIGEAILTINVPITPITLYEAIVRQVKIEVEHKLIDLIRFTIK